MSFSETSRLVTRTASTIEELHHWPDEAEIKYDTGKKQYYSDSNKPVGISATIAHVISRTADDRAKYKAALLQMIVEIDTFGDDSLSEHLGRDFFARRILGQPLTLGALRKSEASFSQSQLARASTSNERKISTAEQKYRLIAK